MKKRFIFFFVVIISSLVLIGQPLPSFKFNEFPWNPEHWPEFNLPSKHNVKRVVLSNKLELEYAEQGDASGTPVIFLHGFTDSWHSFEEVLRYLPSGIHAFVLTQRGHGNSGKPTTNYRPEHFAKDVAAFMKQLKIEKAVIVGHSMGATIAQRFALDNPELTAGLVLMGTFASFPANEGLPEFSKLVNQLKDPIDLAFASEFQKSTLAVPIDSAYLNILIGESMKVPARIWKDVLNGLMPVDYLKQLWQIKNPALIIWGDRDVFCPKKDQTDLQQAIKGSKLSIYEGTGHAVHWEQPQRFANDLLQFINVKDL